MSKKTRKRNVRKQNRRNGEFLGRTFVVCVEIFILILVVGVGLVLVMDGDKKQKSKQFGQNGVKEELLIATNSGVNAEETASGKQVADDEAIVADSEMVNESRYGAELADAQYCRENRIYEISAVSPDEITLAFAGDISFADEYTNMEILRQRGGDITGCFDELLLKEMTDADIFMVNNEFPYTERGTPTEGKTYTFRANPENVRHLHGMGVDIVSVANNHVYDYGEVSLLDTLRTLEETEMPYVGAGRDIEEATKPVYFIANDYKIAYISATQIEQGDFPDTRGAGEDFAGVFRCWEPEKLYEVVEEAKRNSDFVVVYIHWGTELSETLHWSQPDAALGLAKAGADLVVGDHPHCLQEIGYVEGVPVVYSMGNFWFNSKTQDTGILKVTLDASGIRLLQFVPAIQSGCSTKIASDMEKQRILEYIRTLSPTINIDSSGYITQK